VRRLLESAHIVTIPVPYTKEQLVDACLETVRSNRLKSCYLRPLVFIGDGAMGLYATSNPTRVAIVAWKWGAYLGEDGLKNGIRAKVSSFTRPGINMVMAKGKVVGHYVNSVLAKREVMAAGYQEAILLDAQGYVTEASGENLFMVRDGAVHTPPHGSAILGGITRDTMIRIMREMGLTVTERLIARDELYVADEIFLCGTAAEVTPVREVDNRAIGTGRVGPITTRLQQRYFDVVKGSDTSHPEWLTRV